MAENIVEGFRKIVQDLLVPELKSVQVELKHINETVASQGEEIRALRVDMVERFEKVDQRFAAVMEEIADMKHTDVMILGRLDNLLERVNWMDTIRQMQVGLQKVADKVGVEV